MEKKYWKGVEELRNEPEFVRLRDNEFFENLPLDEVVSNKASSTASTSRRDFLKFLGFSVAAASLAACEAPVKKAIPYVIKPEEIYPGIPNYYASTYFDGNDYCSIVVKTREGRPIKIEGNEMSGVTKGGTNARVQASVLSLYDSARLRGPLSNHKPAEWNTVDGEIKNKLAQVVASGKKIAIVSSSIASPTTKKAIADFSAKYPGTQHVVYDAVSYYGLIKGNELSFGKAAIPSYHFENADIIVSFGADFLANWLSPIEFAKQYAQNRKLRNKKNMSRHIQFEANLTLTGSNADNRYRVRASSMGAAISNLYNRIANATGGASIPSTSISVDKEINAVANELLNSKGKALVVARSNNPHVQVLINGINSMLGSYGSTISLDQPNMTRSSNDEAVGNLITDLNNGAVGAVILYNSNPVYTMPSFKDAMAKAGLKISFADREDESATFCDYVCPDHHYLESWNDAEPRKGMFSLTQPTIQPLFNTRQAQESLLKWADAPVADYYTYLQDAWKGIAFPMQTGISSYEAFWAKSLQDGVFETATASAAATTFIGNVQDAAAKIAKPSTGVEVILYEKTGIANGNQGNNPWLHELPDPISKVCWDNYFAVAPAYAEKMGYKQGTVIEVKIANVSVKGPVLLQPGMADETMAIALGYGRTKVGKAGDGVGVNAFPLVTMANGALKYFAAGVTVNKTVDDEYLLASTQMHHTMMGREIVKETTLSEWIKNPRSGNPVEEIETPYGKKEPRHVNLWATEKKPGFPKENHFWNMGIDLNSCIGCGACVVACTAENNVPVVGKNEIMRSREMHWIRIDRYYSSDTTKENAREKNLGKLSMYAQMEKPTSDNPEVVFQPLMCQHCNHAPCETVCPVVATTHSSEGMNMMAYNRCIGTRYCANNCPYKVRRFNWFRYNENEQFPFNQYDNLGKMVLNPDVVVRSRGVMEKCTMCVQRVQYGKLDAKKEGRRPKDGEIKTACSQACPTNAITFGDYNDDNSAVHELYQDPRSYHLLEELDTQPSVFYQTKVRNKQEGKEA